MDQLIRHRFLAVLLVTSLIALSACSTEDEGMETEEGGAMMAESAEPMAGDAPSMAGGMQDTTPPIAEKSEAFVNAYLARADQLAQEGRYAEAKDQVNRALAVAPTNERALAKLAEIKAALGEANGANDLMIEAVEHKKAMRQRQIADVNDAYTRANQAYNLGEYADAKVQLDKAKVTMEYDPYQTDFGSLKGNVFDLSAEVERKLAAESARIESENYESVYGELLNEERREREERISTLKSYTLRGFEAFERQDFDAAEDFARRALNLAPNFRKAKDLLDFARQARHAAWREAYYKTRREQIQQWKAEVRNTQVPWHQILQFPDRDVWDRLTEARKRTGRVQEAQEDSEAVRAVKNRLASETVSFEFADMTLNEAVQTIRDTQNVNILLSKTAREEKGEEPVDLTVTDLNFGDFLKTMLEPLELSYIFKYDMIYVVGKTEASGKVYPEVYEVRDLTLQLPNFQAPKLALNPGPAGEEAAARIFGTPLEPTRDTEPEQLVELVRDNVAPLSWEIEDRDISLSSGQLVAVTTADVHKEIEKFLEDLRQFTKLVVHVETRFISIRDGFLNEIGADWRDGGGSTPGQIANLDDVTNGAEDGASAGLGNGGSGQASQNPGAGAFFQDNNTLDFRGRTENIFNRALGSLLSSTGGATFGFQFLDDIELNFLFTAVEKSVFANVLRAPRLAVYNNQRANLTLVNQVTYVKDYDVEVAQTAYIADPIVDIIQDGLVLDVRPTVSHDRRYVTLELQPTVAILGRPIRTFVTPLAGLTTTVTIELPELQYRSAATTVKVPDGGSVVIGGLKNVSTVDRRSQTPILSQIPILNFFFSKKGRSDEISDLIIVLRVEIIDLEDRERKLAR
ncbi:MAG: tetratricopeptide repeat protein [Planctomycetota bacterium]